MVEGVLGWKVLGREGNGTGGGLEEGVGSDVG